MRKLRSELKNRGIKSKHWASSKGHIHAACDFSRGALYYLLGNPIYAGFVKHKKNMYPGLHEAIISKEMWDKVQASLKAQAAAPRGRSVASHKTLLKGKIFDRGKNLYTPVYTSKRGKHYRYYLNQNISNSADHLQKDMARFPAHMLEQFVHKTLRTELAKSRELAGLLEMDFEEDYNTVSKVVAALAEVTTEELLAIVKKVIVSDDQLAIEVCPNRFKTWVMEKCRVQLQGFDTEAVFKFQVPFQTRRAAKGAWVIKSEKDPDGFLCLPPQELSNLIRGIVWRDEYFTGTPVAIIAEREGLDPSHVHRLIRRSLEIA